MQIHGPTMRNDLQQLQPAVLCGGQSARMGTDKGLIRLEASTWAQTSVDVLSGNGRQVLVSVNPKQAEAYSRVFNEAQLVMDDPSLEINGPLHGLLSLHLRHPERDLMVLACDMPLMKKEVIDLLIDHYLENPLFNAFVFTDGNEPEPLCAIYRAGCLSGILHLYRSGRLERHSMKYMIGKTNTHFIPIPVNLLTCFRNFNAHAEWNGQ